MSLTKSVSAQWFANRRPLCHGNLRAFVRSAQTYPFGGSGFRPNAFQSVAKASAVLLPERFRGGCSFGGGASPTLSRAVSDIAQMKGGVREVNRDQTKRGAT